jgi:uncharacterized protein
MIKITKDNYKYLTFGASVYSTGGGIPLGIHNKMFEDLFTKIDSIDLIEIEKLNDKDFIATSYGVGSSVDTDFDMKPLLEIGLQKLQEITCRKFVGIFPGETNVEFLAFYTAASLGLPVVDADPTGGRAVPELFLDNFNLDNITTLPLVIIDKNLNTKIITKFESFGKIEEDVRDIVVASAGSVICFDHSISVQNAKKTLSLGVLTRSFLLGKMICKSKNMRKVLEFMSATEICAGKVVKIEFNDKVKGEFLEGHYCIENDKNEIFKIYVKNENLVVIKNDLVIASCPDSIIGLDSKTFEGIHNSEIKIGKKILLVSLFATKKWKTKKAINLFSPKNLSLDIY